MTATVMDPEQLGAVLHRRGVTHGAGVPCSYFGGLFHFMAGHAAFRYIAAASEGEAVAIASGMTAAGRRGFALMQNSGLGNAVNPLTSLVVPYGIPLTLLVSHRGQPGFPDEPQHERMGVITEDLVRLCGLECRVLEPGAFDAGLGDALDRGAATAWILRRNALHAGGPHPAPAPIELAPRPIASAAAAHRGEITREDALRRIAPRLAGPGADPPAVISTTGMLSRELFELDDRDHARSNRFYMVGSMGCAAGFGLGVALGTPRRVVVLDGDGAVLMRLGTLATIGAAAPANLHHVVLDNGAHDTTGGQRTASPGVELEAVASACGYRRTATVSTPGELEDRLAAHLDGDGPTFLRVVIAAGHRAGIGRPTLRPRANWERFTSWLAAPITRSG